MRRTGVWSPSSASVAAYWLMLAAPAVLWPCTFFIAAMASAGPAMKPTRQPVMA